MSNLPTVAMRDIELGLPNTNAVSGYTLQHLFQDVHHLATLLGSTAAMVHKLKEANEELKSAIESAAVKEIKGRMEKDMDEVGRMGRLMKDKLNRIFQGVLIPVLNSMPTGHAYPGITVSMTMDPSTLSMITALKKKLKERKKDLEDLGKTIQQDCLEVVQRRISTVTGVKLSDEVIRVIDTNNIMQMFENRVHEIGPEQVGASGEEIKERRAAATDLSKKTVKVQQNFREMLTLVRAQEKIVKALKVQNVVAVAQSTAEELRYELLLELVVMGILFLFFMVLITLALSG